MSTPKSEKKCMFACAVKPITKYNVIYHYIPLQSLGAYCLLSINVMNPALALKFLPKKDMTNVLLINSLFGSSLYIYGRPHLKQLPAKKRATYAAFGGALFSFGSVLVWAVVRSFVRSDQTTMSTILGLGSAAAVARVGYEYLNHIDSLVPADGN